MLVDLYKKSTYMKLRGPWQYEFSMEHILLSTLQSEWYIFSIKLKLPIQDMNCALNNQQYMNIKPAFFFSHCNISFDKKSESKKHSFLSGVKSKCKLIRKFKSTSFFSSLTQIITITVMVWFKITFSEFLFSSNFLYSLLPPHCKFNFTDLLACLQMACQVRVGVMFVSVKTDHFLCMRQALCGYWY